MLTPDTPVTFADGSTVPLRALLTTQAEMYARLALVMMPHGTRVLEPDDNRRAARAALTLDQMRAHDALTRLERQTRAFWWAVCAHRRSYGGGLPLVLRNAQGIKPRALARVMADTGNEGSFARHELVVMANVVALTSARLKTPHADAVQFPHRKKPQEPTFSPQSGAILSEYRALLAAIAQVSLHWAHQTFPRNAHSRWRSRPGAVVFNSARELFDNYHTLLPGDGSPPPFDGIWDNDGHPAKRLMRRFLWYTYADRFVYDPQLVFFSLDASPAGTEDERAPKRAKNYAQALMDSVGQNL